MSIYIWSIWITSSCNSHACSSPPCCRSDSRRHCLRRYHRSSTVHNTSWRRETPWRISRSSPLNPQLRPNAAGKMVDAAESATEWPDPGHESALRPPFSDQWKRFLEKKKYPLIIKLEGDQWVCNRVEKRENSERVFKNGVGGGEKIRGNWKEHAGKISGSVGGKINRKGVVAIVTTWDDSIVTSIYVVHWICTFYIYFHNRIYSTFAWEEVDL